MIKALIILGSVLIPFYELLFRLFPNVAVIAMNTRSHKEAMAMILALAIGLSALYQGTIKPFRNKWLLFFVGFQFITINLMPKIPLVMNNVDISGVWVWKPMFQILCFLLMGAAIASMNLNDIDKKKILEVIFLSAFAMSVFVILQTLGLDQFFKTKGPGIIGKVLFPERVGFLGQPTLVASFMAMAIPLGFYLKKYVFLIFIITAIALTHSQMAIGALVIGLIAYFILLKPKISFTVIPIFLLVSIVGVIKKFIIIGDNGRFLAWKMTLSDILNSPIKGYEGQDFSWFGHGLGSFTFLSSAFSNKFAQAHNDYLEIFYCCGIFGLILFLTALFFVFFHPFKHYLKTLGDERRLTISMLCSLLIISLCAFGSFVWQLGAHQYYSVILAGLLLNETNKGGVKNV